MTTRTLVIVGGAVVAAMLAVSAWAWPQLPADAQVPIHWGPSGEVEGYGPQWAGLMLVDMGIGVVGLFVYSYLVWRDDPARENAEVRP